MYRAKGHFLGIVATPQKVLSAVTLLMQLNLESKGMHENVRKQIWILKEETSQQGLWESHMSN